MLPKIENIFKDNVQKNAITHQYYVQWNMGKQNANLRLTYVKSISTFIAWKTPIAFIATLLFRQMMDLIFLNMQFNDG